MGILNQEYLALKIGIKSYLDLRKRKDYLKWMINERGRLLHFQNIHQGEDCFIIGNGPSLNKMDLSVLNNYYTFGLNKIFLIFRRVKLDLSYLVAVNPLVIEQSLDEYLRMDIPIFLPTIKTIYDISKSNIYCLYTKVKWDFYPQPLNGTSEGFTVTFVAMQLAYYMGFKRVFLIGVDHNFTQKGNPNEIQKMTENDNNHFDPNYFKGHNWHLADLKSSEISYLLAKRYYEMNGREIFDATLDGKLDVFKKIGFDEACELAREKKGDLLQ